MEILMNDLSQQELIPLDNVQIKIEQKNSVPANAKKLISVTSQLLGQKIEINQNEITVTGEIATRYVFINEFEKYDSEDATETFEKKVTVKEYANVNQLFANVFLQNSNWRLSENNVLLENILMVKIEGIKTHNLQVVSDLTGEVEVQKVDQQILSYHSKLDDKFEVAESIQLDNNCEGVLGLDVNPSLKDVAVNDGKVSFKGVCYVNVLGVKTVENTTVPYNTVHKIDFAKSIAVNGISGADFACGDIIVDAVNMHIENGQQGAVLALTMNLIFSGNVYCNCKFSSIVDAISFDKELTLRSRQLNSLEVLPQVNTCVDIESNINLAPNTPYISHVLAVDNMRVVDLQTNVTDNKVLLEGVLCVNLLLENEEHLVIGEHFKVPFQTYVRVDGLDRDYTINSTVIHLIVNVKARRGVELLVDAQLGVEINGEVKKSITIIDSLEEGATKSDDGSAIRIYIIGEKESLWDLAKRTNLSCEALLQQNPNLENGCTPGERIVVYKHENIALYIL